MEMQNTVKLIIFTSPYSGATYCWNGSEVVTIIGSKHHESDRRPRKVGNIVSGFEYVDFETLYDTKSMWFEEGSTVYHIIQIV